MADETKEIEGTVGPYAGQRLTLPAADADAAIADGWARDPFAPLDPNAEPPKLLTDEERQKVLEAANKAASKLRGEEPADEPPKPKPAAKAEQRDMKPD